MSAQPTALETKAAVSRGRLWFGIAGPTAAWVAHGLLSVFAALMTCHQHASSATRPILFGLSAAALVVAIAALVVSLGSFRKLNGEDELLHSQATSREKFMALTGVLVSAVFLLGIVWFALAPLLVRDVCEVFR